MHAVKMIHKYTILFLDLKKCKKMDFHPDPKNLEKSPNNIKIRPKLTMIAIFFCTRSAGLCKPSNCFKHREKSGPGNLGFNPALQHGIVYIRCPGILWPFYIQSVVKELYSQGDPREGAHQGIRLISSRVTKLSQRYNKNTCLTSVKHSFTSSLRLAAVLRSGKAHDE